VILWSLSHLEAARFACDLEHVAWTVGRRPRAGAWDHLAALASDARWCVSTAEGLRIAREATRRCRAYERIAGAHGRALASWYRALALVMFAAARWTP
jgi:hypothetical protein